MTENKPSDGLVEAMARAMAYRMRALWCEWTHGGGQVERDGQGQINWRCSKCRRWGDHPVSPKDESSVTRAALGSAKV